MQIDGNWKIGDKIKFSQESVFFEEGKIHTISDFAPDFFYVDENLFKGYYYHRLYNGEVIKVCNSCEKESCSTMKEI